MKSWLPAPIDDVPDRLILFDGGGTGAFGRVLVAGPVRTAALNVIVASRLLFLPLPRWTMPRAVCFESGDGDRFVFDIDVGFPLVGPVVHYRGWLLPRD
ncbi:MAG TPA: DUF4166 domain-containing protein [Stellaceae bacterium]|jgi:hypothetical protein